MKSLLMLATAGTLLFAVPAVAADFEVKMLNKGADGQAMVFEPAFLKVPAR
jgi:plastocyanin